jgi:predicted acylesterase/phospholipase RssA
MVNKMETEEKVILEQKQIFYDTLVISGGSNKGLLTLGAIQCALDNFIISKVKNYVGTSSGAIISYMLCIGYTPVELLVYLCTNQIFEALQDYNLVNLAQGKGACSFNSLQEKLEKLSIEKIGYLPTLNDLKQKYNKTLVCVTYNYTEKVSEYLSWENYPHLPCITALRMSCNLPIVFEKFRYGNNFYIDGGISDNFPIHYACKIGNKILGINLHKNNEKTEEIESNQEESVLEFFYKLLFIPITQSTQRQIYEAPEQCYIVQINHDFDFKFFNFNIDTKTKMQMFSVGYNEMKDKMFKSSHS